MKAQRVEMFVCPSATPADTSGLQKLADAGKIKPDTLVALVGKTEGTGAHDDWGRIWADAALSDPKDVHLVMVKVPGLTTASIKDAESRGKTVVSHDLTFGPEGAGVYANDAAALGVAMALGEVPESKLADDVVRRNWDLYSEVAMTSSGGEKRHGEVVVFGNSAGSASPLRIGHSVTRDFIDAEGVRNALRAAGLQFKDGLPDEKDLDRLVHVFAKSVIPGSDQVRARLPRPLHPERVQRRRRFDVIDLDRRDLGRVRDQELHEGRVPELAVLVVGEPFVERATDTLRDAALDLALQHQRVDDASAVVHDDVLENLETERFRIDPHISGVAA